MTQPTPIPSSIGALPENFGQTVEESPDYLLTKFLVTHEIMTPHVTPNGTLPPHQRLKQILCDKRWTRRMLEDWFKQGPPLTRKLLVYTPYPEYRAIYLMLLGILEDDGRGETGLGQASGGNAAARKRKLPETKEEQDATQREIDRRIDEYMAEKAMK